MSVTAVVISLLMILANAFFVMFEFSLIAVRRSEMLALADDGNRGAQRVLEQIEQQDGYLAACQLGITLSSLALTAAFEPAVRAVLAPFLENWVSAALAASVSIALAVTVATSVQVVFGELVPKTVAITVPARGVLLTSRVMRWVYVLSTPFNATYNRTANWVVKRLTGTSVHDQTHTDSLDVEVLMGMAYKRGHIDEDQKELIDAVLEFPFRTAREVMTPADRVIGLRMDEDEQKVFETMRRERHVRYPVLQDDDVIGYVLVHDVFRRRLQGSVDLRAILREIVKVPETVRLDRLRADYRDQPIMAVYDEHDQYVGILTSEDVAEEIVGEILDEEDEPERPIVEPLPTGRVLIDGTALIEEVCEKIGVEWEEPNGVDTFGGLVLAQLGREPRVGDEVAMDEWSFQVRAVDGFSILLVEGHNTAGPAAPIEPAAGAAGDANGIKTDSPGQVR